MSSDRWNEDNLRSLVEQSDSFAAVLRALGLAIHAGNYKTLQKKISSIGLDTSHFLGKSWVGQRAELPRVKIPLEDILVEGSAYATAHLRVRLLKEGIFTPECQSCRLSEWQGFPIPLELDHVNGVSNDHRIENLRLLCPNCHALTPTWKGRNAKHPVSMCACGSEKTRAASQCAKCAALRPRPTKIEWPPKETLRARVAVSNMSAVGRELGVSANAVKKRLRD